MPKDKTATHAKLYECMRAEFLEKGFEKASLNNIARQCGITPAAVYRHYASKEAMFEALVKPAWDEFNKLCERSMSAIKNEIHTDHTTTHFDDDDNIWFKPMLDLIYKYFDEFRLLVVCSKGTKYENFADILIKMEEDTSKEMMAAMDAEGLPRAEISDVQYHLAATAYVEAMLEIIRHSIPKEEAKEQFAFIYKFFHLAWKSLYNM